MCLWDSCHCTVHGRDCWRGGGGEERRGEGGDEGRRWEGEEEMREGDGRVGKRLR